MFEAKKFHLTCRVNEKGNQSQTSQTSTSISHIFTPSTPTSVADDMYLSFEYRTPPHLNSVNEDMSHLSLKSSLSSLPSITNHPYSNYSNHSLHSPIPYHNPYHSPASSSHTIQLNPSETALTPNFAATAAPDKLTNNEDNFSLDTAYTVSNSRSSTDHQQKDSLSRPSITCEDKHKATNQENKSISKRSIHNGTYNESKQDEKSTNAVADIYEEDEKEETLSPILTDVIDIEELFLAKHGYKRGKKIATTLQGFIYELESVQTGVKYVVKQTDKYLHSKHITIQNGKKYKVKEDILNEKNILETITKQDAPSFMVKYIDFFESNEYYYLVMEHGGADLFDFILQAHQHIQNGSLSIKEWRKFVKYIFWQMCVMLLWLHNTAHATHLDVSLENILVQNARFIDKGNGEVTIPTDIQIKLCDFGLAQLYDVDENNVFNGGYLSAKYCGKTNYKSPQVYSKKGEFDGRKADVWSLGVVLFCMAVGAPPYRVPTETDECFAHYIETGRIASLLYQWKRHHYVTERMLSVLECLLKKDEHSRYLMDDIVQHPWLRTYYAKYYQIIKPDLLSVMYQNTIH